MEELPDPSHDGTLSWRQMPDGLDKREAFLRQARLVRRRPSALPPQAPRRAYRPGWILALALALVAIWLLT